MTTALQASEARAAAGATAPRVSLRDMENAIVAKHTFVLGDALRGLGQPVSEPVRLMTQCVLVFQNGFSIVGTSACASPENFDAAKGAEFAYADAIKQAWPLFGFALRNTLSLSAPLQAAIRNELAGLPAHREDVNPTMVPALAEPPAEGTFTMARSVLVDSEEDADALDAAWAQVRAAVHEAEPPFPRHLLGYTILRGDGDALAGYMLTVYA